MCLSTSFTYHLLDRLNTGSKTVTHRQTDFISLSDLFPINKPGNQSTLSIQASVPTTTRCVVQVSNWFANARRRLKNTVRRPDLSWALRIKLYNQCIQGNAEKLSVCSDDSEGKGPTINPCI